MIALEVSCPMWFPALSRVTNAIETCTSPLRMATEPTGRCREQDLHQRPALLIVQLMLRGVAQVNPGVPTRLNS